MIIFKNVSFTYKKANKPVVQDLDGQISSNLVITGPSGSGKSTILRFINGLIPHFYEGKFTGDVIVAGKNTRKLSTCALFKLAGYIHQNADAQIFNDNIENEIIFTLENAGLPVTVIKERLRWMIEEFDLQRIANKKSHELSGGEKRILTIASALSPKPKIMLLDEPFSTLDGFYRKKLLRLLQGMSDTLIVLTEHRIDGTETFAKRYMFIQDSANRIISDDLFKVNFSDFRVREPENLRLARIAGFVEIPESEELIRKLLEIGYSPEFSPPTPTGEKVLELEEVSFSFGNKFSLKNVNVELFSGEIVVLLGPNGAGKTTVMKLMTGIRNPEKGRVIRKTRTGYVPHNPQDIFFKARVIDEIKVNMRGNEDWLDKLISLLNLENLLEKSPFLLSEGEKKRVAMAAILAIKPGILLLDEPTVGQDGETILAIEKIIKDLSKEGIAIIVSTHDLEFARRISSRWLLISNGVIKGEINPANVTRRDIELLESLHLDPGIELHIQAIKNESKG